MHCTAGSSSVACPAGAELAVAWRYLQPWGWLGQPLVQGQAEEMELTGMVCDPLCSLGLLGCVQALPPPVVEVPALHHSAPPPEQRAVLPQLTPGRKLFPFPSPALLSLPIMYPVLGRGIP